MSRLASLHRGVIRALHVYVRSMSDADVCHGVLAGCRDLAAVVRHLTLCSVKLDVASNTSPKPDDVLSLLDDILVWTPWQNQFYYVLVLAVVLTLICSEIFLHLLMPPPPADWRRQLGRPGITWLSTIQQDLKHHHLTLPEAADLAQNHPLWRMMSTYGATQSWVACHKRRRCMVY